LPATHTTAENPNGANVGNGFTGKSGVGTSDSESSPATWQHERVDLTPYVGSTILLRFEYVTDAAYSGPGMALANISIPALHWSDDPGHPDGWTAVGWLVTDNAVPVHYQVRGVLIAQDTTISAIPIDDRGHGVFQASSDPDLKKLVLIVMPFAAKTSEPVRFSVTVEASG
jgi:immune inhibitor A